MNIENCCLCINWALKLNLLRTPMHDAVLCYMYAYNCVQWIQLCLKGTAIVHIKYNCVCSTCIEIVYIIYATYRHINNNNQEPYCENAHMLITYSMLYSCGRPAESLPQLVTFHVSWSRCPTQSPDQAHPVVHCSQNILNDVHEYYWLCLSVWPPLPALHNHSKKHNKQFQESMWWHKVASYV